MKVNLFSFSRFRCATGEAWPSIMLSCAPPKPCDPRTNMNKTFARMMNQKLLTDPDYYTQSLTSSFKQMVIDTNASSTVDLYDKTGPRVLASSGKLTDHEQELVGKCN